MKKFVKPLVIASSVAAIAGIGAVSFAAWTSGTPSTESATGSTSTIITEAGTVTITPASATALVPYDQGSGTTIHTFTVAYSDESGAKAPASTYKFTLTVENEATLPLYYKLGSSVSTPTRGDTLVPTGWESLTGSIVLTDLASTGTVTINVILASDASGAAAKAEMGKDYTLTVTATLAD
ncbi:MAG: hypothetical protein J1G38_07345 [Clostridiales bacterium]|nr:hypothetical protein [Clostridiales bacterium]